MLFVHYQRLVHTPRLNSLLLRSMTTGNSLRVMSVCSLYVITSVSVCKCSTEHGWVVIFLSEHDGLGKEQFLCPALGMRGQLPNV